MRIVINDRATVMAISELQKQLAKPERVYRILGQHFRDYVRQTLRMHGRKRKHADLSIWTKKRTGRRTAFNNRFIMGVLFRYGPQRVEIYHDSHSPNWDAGMHHKGYTTPTRWGNPFMVIPIKLGWREMGVEKGGRIFLRRAGPSVIPAREIWPTKTEATGEARKIVQDWLRRLARDAGFRR